MPILAIGCRSIRPTAVQSILYKVCLCYELMVIQSNCFRHRQSILKSPADVGGIVRYDLVAYKIVSHCLVHTIVVSHYKQSSLFVRIYDGAESEFSTIIQITLLCVHLLSSRLVEPMLALFAYRTYLHLAQSAQPQLYRCIHRPS